MRLKKWAPAVAAIVLGGGAAMMFRNMTTKPATTVVAEKTLQVVPATSDLIVGQELRAENLAMRQIPTPDKPIDYCTDPAKLVGRVLVKPVLKGQFIHESDMAPLGAMAELPSLVPAGMRAMTIPVDEGNSQAGMLMPGCHVDVIGTFPNGRKGVTRTLLRNILVQAVGQRLTSAKPADGKEPPPYRTVTLILTPRDAEILDMTTSSGRMRLLLRGFVKSDNEVDPGNVFVSDLIPGDPDEKGAIGAPATQPSNPLVASATAVPPQPKVYRVELLKGGLAASYVEFPDNRPEPQADADINDMKAKQFPEAENERE